MMEMAPQEAERLLVGEKKAPKEVCQMKRHKAGVPENLRSGRERRGLEYLKERGMHKLQEDRWEKKEWQKPGHENLINQPGALKTLEGF